jgi:RecA-family ATPase
MTRIDLDDLPWDDRPPGDQPPPPEPPDSSPPEPELMVRRLSDVAPETVTFLWKGRIPVGKLTALGGDPGLGKSYLTIALAAPVTRGVDLADVDIPDDTMVTEAGDVVIASFEDDAADTLRPRAEKLGADLTRFHVIEGVRDADGKMRPFCPDDVDRLELLIATLPHPRLLVIDPVGGWVGGRVDTYRDNDVRAALKGLRLLAGRYRLAVLLVMHLRKSAAHNALARFSGSGAYGQIVRSALLVGKHPDDETMNALAHIKHNLAAKQPTLGYRIDDTGLHWTGLLDLDGEQLAGHDTGEGHTERVEAKDWLRELLDAEGEVEAEDVKRLAKRAGISSETTLQRARRDIKAHSYRKGFGKGAVYWWSLTPT